MVSPISLNDGNTNSSNRSSSPNNSTSNAGNPPKGPEGEDANRPEEEFPEGEPPAGEPEAELSASTQRVYQAGWRDFVGWCRERDVQVLPAPPEAVADFLKDREDLALSTIRNRLSAIRHYHEVSGLEAPTGELAVSSVWHKISERKRSEEGHRSGAEEKLVSFPPGKMIKEGPDLLPEYFSRLSAENEDLEAKLEQARETWSDEFIDADRASAARLTEDQKRLVPEVKYDLVDLRDRALLLLMGAGGASRSEVARLDVTDVVPAGGEIRVGVRKKNGMPKRVLRAEPEDELRYCTARAVAAWILTAGLSEGPLFRSFDAHENMKPARISLSSVNYLLEQRAEEAGLDPGDWSPSRLGEEP